MYPSKTEHSVEVKQKAMTSKHNCVAIFTFDLYMEWINNVFLCVMFANNKIKAHICFGPKT